MAEHMGSTKMFWRAWYDTNMWAAQIFRTFFYLRFWVTVPVEYAPVLRAQDFGFSTCHVSFCSTGACDARRAVVKCLHTSLLFNIPQAYSLVVTTRHDLTRCRRQGPANPERRKPALGSRWATKGNTKKTKESSHFWIWRNRGYSM